MTSQFDGVEQFTVFCSEPMAVVARRRGCSESLRHRVDPMKMTASEIRVVRLLAQGNSNKEIARLMKISIDGVKYHLKNAYQKLGARQRVHAVIRARETGILSP